jgi:hypothetical protein
MSRHGIEERSIAILSKRERMESSAGSTPHGTTLYEAIIFILLLTFSKFNLTKFSTIYLHIGMSQPANQTKKSHRAIRRLTLQIAFLPSANPLVPATTPKGSMQGDHRRRFAIETDRVLNAVGDTLLLREGIAWHSWSARLARSCCAFH